MQCKEDFTTCKCKIQARDMYNRETQPVHGGWRRAHFIYMRVNYIHFKASAMCPLLRLFKYLSR